MFEYYGRDMSFFSYSLSLFIFFIILLSVVEHIRFYKAAFLSPFHFSPIGCAPINNWSKNQKGEYLLNMNLNKNDNESQLQYHKRLVYGKLVDKTLADIDYSELAEYVYGQPYSSDVARRMMYGSKKTLDLVNSERLSEASDDALSEIDSKIIELKKERQKFFDQRREYEKLIRTSGRQDYLYEALISSADKLSDTVGKIYGCRQPMQSSDNDAVLVFTDWHYGMTTNNVFNKYNTKICKDRVVSVVNSAKNKLLLHQCNTLHVVVLGDLYHGAIHVGTRVASEELVCDQIMQVSEILAQSILELSECVDNVIVYMTYGNHGRTIQNKNDSVHRDNIERIIPWWLKERLANVGAKNVKISQDTNTEFLVIDAAGHSICASHGDLDHVKTSPRLLPILMQKEFGKNIEYILLADKHHTESFEELGITAQVCGALCGCDDYANDKRLYSNPSQLLLIVNPEYGIDAEYKLKV